MSTRRRRSPALPFVIALIVLALALVGGAWLYQREAQRVRAETLAELALIAQLKVGQIINWRNERLADVDFSVRGPFFGQVLAKWADTPEQAERGDEILARLHDFRKLPGYESALLATEAGTALISTQPTLDALAPAEVAAAELAISKRRPAMSNFFRVPDGTVRISVVGSFAGPDGVMRLLVLRRNPDRDIFPLVQRWPTSSPSAETMLVTRDGGDVLYINRLRQRPGQPMSLRVAMRDPSLLSSKAVRTGKADTFEKAVDYLGVPVVGRSEPIPGTPWMLVTKIDESEILAEARGRGLMIFTLVLLSILLSALGVMAAYDRRQRDLFRELYRAEQAHRGGEDVFRTTLYSIGDAVITTDNAASVRHVNPVAAALTGWTEADALGRPVDTVLNFVQQHERAPIATPLARILDESRILDFPRDAVLVARDGTQRSVEGSWAPIRSGGDDVTGVVIAFRDQTEQRNREAATERTKDQLRGVVDATLDALAAVDADYRYVALNPAYARSVHRLFGIPVAPGDTVQDVLARVPHQKNIALESFARALAGEQFVVTREFGGQTSERFYYELAYSPIRNAAGIVVGAVHSGRDVTERVRAQVHLAASESSLRIVNDELEHLVEERTREATTARHQAEASNRIKDIFIATMSHELRTPLNSIIGFSEIMLEGITGALNDEQRTQLGIIHQSGQQLLGLIGDVLDISKIEAGQLALRLAPVELPELLREQQKMFQPQATERGLDLKFSLPDEPLIVLADAQRVRQVLANLLSNAIKYTDCGRVGLDAEASGSLARITVWDSGIGIAPEDIDKLFQPFQRIAPTDGGDARDGTGLGLAISRRLVERMDGAIGVTSEPGRGSRFWFTLPLA